MRAPKETEIQSQIIAALKRAGIWVRRNRQYGRGNKAGGLGPGSPDLVVCHQGRFIGLEVKKPETAKGTSDDQDEWAEEIRRAGGRYYVVTSVREAMTAVFGIGERAA